MPVPGKKGSGLRHSEKELPVLSITKVPLPIITKLYENNRILLCKVVVKIV
jgi:hypothetical protein